MLNQCYCSLTNVHFFLCGLPILAPHLTCTILFFSMPHSIALAFVLHTPTCVQAWRWLAFVRHDTHQSPLQLLLMVHSTIGGRYEGLHVGHDGHRECISLDMIKLHLVPGEVMLPALLPWWGRPLAKGPDVFSQVVFSLIWSLL